MRAKRRRKGKGKGRREKGEDGDEWWWMRGDENEFDGDGEGRRRGRRIKRNAEEITLRTKQYITCEEEDTQKELTWPCWSRLLLVSLSLWNVHGCFIQCAPEAGESGWIYRRPGM